jgi:hypothetical protein
MCRNLLIGLLALVLWSPGKGRVFAEVVIDDEALPQICKGGAPDGCTNAGAECVVGGASGTCGNNTANVCVCNT